MVNVLCFDRGGVSGWDAFAGDVAALRAEIADASAVCNMLADRYDFMVALAAAQLNGQVTVLPPSTAPLAVEAALADSAGEAILLGTVPPLGIGGRRLTAIPKPGVIGDGAALRQALARSAGRVHVFTSGSTGQPVRHVKPWPTVVQGAAVTEELLAWAGLQARRVGIIGTTPQQHMYGLEAAIGTALGHGRAVFRGTVFYAADLELAVAAARAAGLEAVVLATSPAHLRYLEPAIAGLGDIRLVISATAPLSAETAARLEARGGLVVTEIYGSTETGSLAGRRTASESVWTPMAGFALKAEGAAAIARAPHLLEPQRLNDAVEIGKDGRFRLFGRLGDHIQVAGKRSSLVALNLALQGVRGVRDAVAVHRRSPEGDRLGVVAVLDSAAGFSEAEARERIKRQVRDHLDPVFVPQRIVFVEQLPRTATGKISSQNLSDLSRSVLE